MRIWSQISRSAACPLGSTTAYNVNIISGNQQGHGSKSVPFSFLVPGLGGQERPTHTNLAHSFSPDLSSSALIPSLPAAEQLKPQLFPCAREPETASSPLLFPEPRRPARHELAGSSLISTRVHATLCQFESSPL